MTYRVEIYRVDGRTEVRHITASQDVATAPSPGVAVLHELHAAYPAGTRFSVSAACDRR